MIVQEGGYAEAYVPFCGLAVLEALSGIRTPVEDHELEMFSLWQPGARAQAAAEVDQAWAEADGPLLAAAIAGPWRGDANRARDLHRHPYQTLQFFGVGSRVRVIEINNGSRLLRTASTAVIGLVATLIICALASVIAIRMALRVDPAVAIGG